MISVSITFNGQPPAFITLYYEIDEVSPAGDLWLNTVAALDQFVEHLELKTRLTLIAQRIDFFRVLSEGLPEMADETGVQSVFFERRLINRAEQICAVAGTR